MPHQDELDALRTGNTRLRALLETHGIEWRPRPGPSPTAAPEPSRLSTDEKVALFRRLFRGRTDIYPIRWESKASGKSGYSPASANESRAGVCEKPRIKCSECSNRALIALSDAVIYAHLAGEHTVGVYPLLKDDTCCFLAVDFDEAEWREDARALIQSCMELGVPAALAISRSGQGAHAWLFFAGRVPARAGADTVRRGRPVEIDNSAAERALRGVALGRNNYLFIGSNDGERAAALYSLVETAKLNGLDPEAYLREVIQRMVNLRLSTTIFLSPCSTGFIFFRKIRWRPAPARRTRLTGRLTP